MPCHDPFVMVAPTGARRSKADHPNLPVAIDEIVDEAVACKDAGADGLHLHVRDANGAHSLDPGIYREALSELNARLPGFPVQITTEAAGRYSVEDQLSLLEALRPEAASISVREIARSRDLARQVYETCRDAGTQVQHILYDPTDLQQLSYWRRRGIVDAAQSSVIFVLGRYDDESQNSGALSAFLAAKPDYITDWMVCAFGVGELPALLDAASNGGNLRIGFENNIHRPDGSRAASNAENVAALRKALSLQVHSKELVS